MAQSIQPFSKLALIINASGIAFEHTPSQPCPIVVVTIHDEGRLRVLCEVPQAPQPPPTGLRLIVNDGIDPALDNRVADRNDMRSP